MDYVIWLTHFGQTAGGGKTIGDFDGNGIVDGVDYVIWLNTYTGTVSTPTPTPTATRTGTPTRTPTPGGSVTPTPTTGTSTPPPDLLQYLDLSTGNHAFTYQRFSLEFGPVGSQRQLGLGEFRRQQQHARRVYLGGCFGGGKIKR